MSYCHSAILPGCIRAPLISTRERVRGKVACTAVEVGSRRRRRRVVCRASSCLEPRDRRLLVATSAFAQQGIAGRSAWEPRGLGGLQPGNPTRCSRLQRLHAPDRETGRRWRTTGPTNHHFDPRRRLWRTCALCRQCALCCAQLQKAGRLASGRDSNNRSSPPFFSAPGCYAKL